MNRFMEDYSVQKLRRTTLQGYRTIVKNDINPNLGHIQAKKLSAQHITDYYSWAMKNGRKDGSGGLSERTVHHIHSLLRKAFNLAVKRKWVAHNPVRDADPPSPQAVEMQAFTAEQLVEILALIKGTKYELPILIGAFTGMRRGEILGLHWDCVDLERRTITVIRTLEEVREGLFIGPTKTTSSRRTIPISDTLVKALSAHKGLQDTQKSDMAELYVDNGLVCAEDDGRPMRPKYLSTAFRQLVDKSGLPRVRFHDLSRHTPATIMLTNGEPAKVVQEHLGHANYAITMDIYSHVPMRMSRDAAERYEKTIQEAEAKRNSRQA